MILVDTSVWIDHFRFTLRDKKKVNTQWQLFSLVHNIEKLARQWAV